MKIKEKQMNRINHCEGSLKKKSMKDIIETKNWPIKSPTKLSIHTEIEIKNKKCMMKACTYCFQLDEMYISLCSKINGW
jgi:hypothetical protein